MKVIVTENKIQGGAKAFEIFEKVLRTVLRYQVQQPVLPLKHFTKMGKERPEDLTSINLDEYVGLTPDNPQSYHYLCKSTIDKKPFKTYIPDGMAKDIPAFCKKYDQIIKDNLSTSNYQVSVVTAIIAFNEPGTPFDIGTHEVKLTENTIEANAHFFDNEDEVPKSAIAWVR